MTVSVHKAVEPDNLSVAGKKRYQKLLAGLAGLPGGYRAIVQRKYDGVYAQAVYNPAAKAWEFFSRTGQRLKSIDRPIYDVFDAKALPERRYNGELWLPNHAHSDINGRSRKQTPQFLNFILFDSFDPAKPEEIYEDRLEYLFHGGGVVTKASPVPFEGSEADLYDEARSVTGLTSAYDGLMLKDLDGLYVEGRGKDGEFIKIKPRKTIDLRVVGTTEGVGNRKGGIGALVVDLGGGKTNEVGSGLTMADVFDREFLNLIVEVEYLGLTKDGHLREPVYIRTRHDKTEPDMLPGPSEED